MTGNGESVFGTAANGPRPYVPQAPCDALREVTRSLRHWAQQTQCLGVMIGMSMRKHTHQTTSQSQSCNRSGRWQSARGVPFGGTHAVIAVAANLPAPRCGHALAALATAGRPSCMTRCRRTWSMLCIRTRGLTAGAHTRGALRVKTPQAHLPTGAPAGGSGPLPPCARGNRDQGVAKGAGTELMIART